jgi:hypothetical protein
MKDKNPIGAWIIKMLQIVQAKENANARKVSFILGSTTLTGEKQKNFHIRWAGLHYTFSHTDSMTDLILLESNFNRYSILQPKVHQQDKNVRHSFGIWNQQ